MKRRKPRKTYQVQNLAMVASFFGVSITTTAKWRTRGMPGVPTAWDLAEIARWRELRHREDLERARREDDPKRAIDEVRAKILRLKYRTDRGRYVTVTRYEEDLSRLCTVLRSGVLAFAATLPDQIEGLEARRIREIVQDKADYLLESLSQTAPHAINGTTAKAPQKKREKRSA